MDAITTIVRCVIYLRVSLDATGEHDVIVAYVAAFGEAQHVIRELTALAAIAERLGGDDV